MCNALNNVTFGIEIECILTSDLFTDDRGYKLDTIPKFARKLLKLSDGWKLKTDGSIQTNGNNSYEFPIEIISPPLTGYEGLAEIKRLLTFLTDHAYVNDSCGGHVHIGLNGLFGLNTKDHENKQESRDWNRRRESFRTRFARPKARLKQEISPPVMAQFVQNLTLLVAAYEDCIFSYSGGKTRQNNTQYCKAAKSKDVLENLQREKYLLAYNGNRDSARYRAINVTSIAKHGTVEFRLFAGAINSDEWLTNILVANKLATMARDNATIPHFTRGLTRKNMDKLFKVVFGDHIPKFANRLSIFDKES